MARKRKPRKWARLTILEPFPLFYSHINQTSVLANDSRTEGPFYAPNSEWLDFPENIQAYENQAKTLREKGYTVVVDIVER